MVVLSLLGGMVMTELTARGAGLPFGGMALRSGPLDDLTLPEPSQRRQPSVTVADGGGYNVERSDIDGQEVAVRFSPCATIDVVWNVAGAPEGVLGAVSDAVAEVGHHSGLDFTMEGPTDEPPDPQRSAYQPQRYGARNAPLLIAWSDDASSPELAGDTAGRGGGTYVVRHDGSSVVATRVTGLIELDAAELAAMTTPDRAAALKLVVIHELGHVLGLAHSSDPISVMYPTLSDVTTMTEADLAGFAFAGSGPCPASG